MWEVSDSWREALAGSREMTALAVITRDGDELTADGGIEPTSWRIVSSLSGSQVQSKLDLVITDPDGDMLTEDPLSPLQVYGQRVSLDVTVAVGEWSESLPMGIWRLNSSQPSGGPWRYYAGTWVRPAQTVSVSAEDLLVLVSEYGFLGLSTPASGATSETEVRRLLDGTLTYDMGGLASKDVARAPWSGSRLDAILSVIGDLDAVAVVGRDGVLTLVPAKGTGKTVSITAATEPGWGLGLIDWPPQATREGVVNGVAATGTSLDGATLYGRALESSGPTAWSSSGFGRVTTDASNASWTTQAKTTAGAASTLTKLTRERAQTLTVTTLPDPSIDVLDTAAITLPESGRVISGLITEVQIGSTGPMQLTVSVPYGEAIYG